MRTHALRTLLLNLLLALLAPTGAPWAQGADPGAQAADEAPAPFEVPRSVAEAVALETSALEEALEGRSQAELEALLTEWMGLVEAQHRQFAGALAADEGSELRKAATSLGSDRDALISRAEILIAAVAEAGGSVEDARERIAYIRQAEAQELDRVTTVPADQSQAQDLALETLRAQLRPLTKEQVGEQLKQWTALLQKKCLEVRNVEVAALESEDPEEIEKFNGRAVELRGERGRLIERVKVVIAALERKNGDVEDARAYLKSVVVAPPIQGWRAAWTTSRAWLVSPDGGIALGVRLVQAFGLLAAFWLLSRAAARLMARATRKMKKASALLREFIVGGVRKGILFIGLLVAANQLGINMGPLLAVIGATGLVVGFALQGTLSNFASGLLIMIYRPFDVGDVIDAGGVIGKVDGMTLVSTQIKTFDNRAINVPNNKIWGDVITNVTAYPTRRVDMTFGIGYGDDIDRAREVLAQVVSAHEKVLSEPKPTIEVSTFGDSSVNLIVRPWTRTEDYWTVMWDLNRQVKQRFDEVGISIPFPQRDIHVHHHEADGASAVLQPPTKAGERAAEAVPSSGDRPTPSTA